MEGVGLHHPPCRRSVHTIPETVVVTIRQLVAIVASAHEHCHKVPLAPDWISRLWLLDSGPDHHLKERVTTDYQHRSVTVSDLTGHKLMEKVSSLSRLLLRKLSHYAKGQCKTSHCAEGHLCQ